MRKPCIWYVSKYVAPSTQTSVGGRGYLIMREIARMGYKAVVITSDSNQLVDVPELSQRYVFQQRDGIEVCWVRTLKYRVAKSVRRVLSWLDFEWRLLRLPKSRLPPPDVVIVSSLSLLTILNGFLLRRHYRCRLIFEIRDIWPLTIIEEGRFSKLNPLVLVLGFIEKLGYKYSDAIVGTMPNLSQHVASVLGNPQPTHCIPMGVEEDSTVTSVPLEPEYEATYMPNGKFVVAYVGTIGITNALDTFFDCAAAMQSEEMVHFLVVGEGDLRANFQATFHHLRNLTFAPRVPKNTVQSVLARCDLLYFSVYPSAVWKYGQSLNKVIDYMLSGKPIVASYSGYPSMINEAQCGTFVPAGDLASLRREVQRYAAMNPDRRAAIGARGREWLLTHRSYRALAGNYLKVMFPASGACKQPELRHEAYL